MSARGVTGTETTTLSPARDARLVPYCLIAIGAAGTSLVTGQPALAALAVPFALALALGLRCTAPVCVVARVTLDADQVLEGDIVAGLIELEWDGELEPHVILHRLAGVSAVAVGDATTPALAAQRSIAIPIKLQATQWGRHTVAEVWLRLRTPWGLVSWTGKVATAPVLRVLPGSERLASLLDPAEYRAVMGMHRSRRPGDGYEFAEIRPYTPGDRLRDLNWAATARRHTPLVNRHHPELSGDVVIALDAFADGSRGSSEALTRAARAAWAVASIHLRAYDRVGLAGLGGSTRWLAPANGRRAKYQLLETLLSIGSEAHRNAVVRRGGERIAVPRSALVVAITPLHDERTIGILQAWRARGRTVAVVVVETVHLLDPPRTAGESLARRMWQIEHDRRRRLLTDAGIAVVALPPSGSIRSVISALRRVSPGRRR